MRRSDRDDSSNRLVGTKEQGADKFVSILFRTLDLRERLFGVASRDIADDLPEFVAAIDRLHIG